MAPRWRALWLTTVLASTGVADEASTAALVCSGCHSDDASVPPLGTDADRIEATMLAFRRGTRMATVMDRIAKGYTEAEIAALANALAVGGNADD